LWPSHPQLSFLAYRNILSCVDADKARLSTEDEAELAFPVF